MEPLNDDGAIARLKNSLHEIIFEADTPAGKLFDVALIGCIVISLILVMLDSTAIFREIVAEERAAGLGQGDHFGENERIWNSIQKACLKDPDLFIDYYGNPVLAIACQAWLGPFYQITAQMNSVKPANIPSGSK